MVLRKKNPTIPKTTIYSKVYGKGILALPPDHPMFCCQSFQNCVLDQPDVGVAYNPVGRFYYWVTSKKDTSVSMIPRCPYCGKEWPKNLYLKFFEELGKVMGHKIVYMDFDWTILPEEFKSEEWWRKRGI